MLGAMNNWDGGWVMSEIVEVILPDIILKIIAFKYMLFIRVLVLLLTLVV